jgi:hypothetical protein
MSFGYLSLDLIILIVVIGVLMFLSFKFGKKLLYSLILSTYPALIIAKNVPYIKIETTTEYLIAFLVAYILLNFALMKSLHPRNPYGKIAKFIEYTILVLAFLILIRSIGLNEITGMLKYITFSGHIDKVISKIPYGLTLIIPVLAIFFTSKKESF